jgi:hypothetical protein
MPAASGLDRREKWESILGRTVAEFRAGASPWVGDEVAAHALLLSGFTAFRQAASKGRCCAVDAAEACQEVASLRPRKSPIGEAP